jgi:hypothetical protein
MLADRDRQLSGKARGSTCEQLSAAATPNIRPMTSAKKALTIMVEWLSREYRADPC